MNHYLTLSNHIWISALILFAGLMIGHRTTYGQDRAPKVVSQPEFRLSQDAIAAGIDGVLGVSLKIDKSGKVDDVIIHGGPAWPCGSPKPKGQIEAVRDAVKEQLLATMFEPPVKNGKPADVELSLQFAIGEAYKMVVREEDAKKREADGTKLVDAGMIRGRATRLVEPALIGTSGVVVVLAQIDENGNVIHAGAINGHPHLQENARKAACESKFSPTVIHGKPVKVTGTITYAFRRN